MAHNLASGSNNFLVPNGTFFVEIIAFFVILWILWKYVIPPVQKAMTDRQDTIARQLSEGQQAEERLKQAEAEYQKALTDARHRAAQLRAEGEQQKKEIVDSAAEAARQAAEEVNSRARAQLEADRRQIVRELRAEIGTLAVDLAGKIVGESLQDDERQQRITERFLADLEAQGAQDETELVR